jgi:hypothetical protein
MLVAVGLLATGTLLPACDYARPIETVCGERLTRTEVHVVAAPVEYATDYSRTSAELTQTSDPGAGRIVNGITRANLKSSISLRGHEIENPVTRKHCLRPVVDVSLAFTPMTVYIRPL